MGDNRSEAEIQSERLAVARAQRDAAEAAAAQRALDAAKSSRGRRS